VACRGVPEAVLFDLDGTLIDSAPDLLAALDHVLADLGRPAADRRQLREHVSRGAAGLLEAGLPEWRRWGEKQREEVRGQLLDFYAEHCWDRSAPFDGVEGLLSDLQSRHVPMGIVTNKISRFAEPLLERAGWSERFVCLVTGDRVARPKPDPEPVLKACRALDVSPARTLFVGDDRRDVLAGRAAGTGTLVAAWGYLPAGERAHDWNADGVIDAPSELLLHFPRPEAG